MASLSAGTTFTDGVANDVTAAKLGALVNNATPTSGLIQDRTAETITATNDTLLIGDASDSNNLKRITVANFAQTLPTAKITTGTIETATLGTTTSTAANITNGTIQTLTSSTLGGSLTGGTYSGVINSSSGTFGGLMNGSLNATSGTIQTITSSTLASSLTGGTYSGVINSTNGTINATIGTISTINATTGTIANISTTISGDFSISQGTGTLGTTGVTVGTYGTSDQIPRISIDSKGRITSATSFSLQQPKILQVLQSVKTDTASFTSSSFTSISGLSVSVTPSSTANKILVMLNINYSNSAGTSPSYFRIYRDSTEIYTGDAAGVRTTTGLSGAGLVNSLCAENGSLIFLDSPSSTSSITYDARASSSGGTIYVNRSPNDGNFTNRGRNASSITVMEVV